MRRITVRVNSCSEDALISRLSKYETIRSRMEIEKDSGPWRLRRKHQIYATNEIKSTEPVVSSVLMDEMDVTNIV